MGAHRFHGLLRREAQVVIGHALPCLIHTEILRMLRVQGPRQQGFEGVEFVFHGHAFPLAQFQEIAARPAADEGFQRIDGIVRSGGVQADDIESGRIDTPFPFSQAKGCDIAGIDDHASPFRDRRHPAGKEHRRLVEVRRCVVGRDQGIPAHFPAGSRFALEDAHPETAVQVKSQRSQLFTRDAAADAVAPGGDFRPRLDRREIPVEVELPVILRLVVHHTACGIDLGAIIGLRQCRIRGEEEFHPVFRVHVPFIREGVRHRKGGVAHFEAEEETVRRAVAVETRIIVEAAPGRVQSGRGKALPDIHDGLDVTGTAGQRQGGEQGQAQAKQGPHSIYILHYDKDNAFH